MFSPWERANPARSHGFSPLEKFFCFLKTFFKNLLTNPRRCDRITLVPQERDETKKKWTISSAGMSIRLTCGRSQVQVLYRPPPSSEFILNSDVFLCSERPIACKYHLPLPPRRPASALSNFDEVIDDLFQCVKLRFPLCRFRCDLFIKATF